MPTTDDDDKAAEQARYGRNRWARMFWWLVIAGFGLTFCVLLLHVYLTYS